MRIAIIGAGAAGLAALRRCKEAAAGAPVEALIFEKTDRVGGTWVYVPERGRDAHGLPIHSSMYDSLRTNLPKEVMGYPDYPIPENEANRSYLHRTEILSFLESYCDHFELREHILFEHNVELVEPVASSEQWRVRARDLRRDEPVEMYFDAVMVCNGHYFEPALPAIQGQSSFRGEQLHSHDYRTPEPFAGKRVVVIGAGPSGMDLAMEISKKASFVYLSHHSKETILTQFPPNVAQKPDVLELTENSAVFRDGSQEPVDIVFYCTGYNYSFPFLAASCGIQVDSNMVTPLWKHVIAIEQPSLAFIGLPFYVCAFSMFDLQARFVLEHWLKRRALPGREAMLAEEARERRERLVERGFSKRQFHMMGPLQAGYYDELAQAAGIPGLPSVLTKLHNHSSNRFLDDLGHYREDRFKIVDADSYVQLE